MTQSVAEQVAKPKIRGLHIIEPVPPGSEHEVFSANSNKTGLSVRSIPAQNLILELSQALDSIEYLSFLSSSVPLYKSIFDSIILRLSTTFRAERATIFLVNNITQKLQSVVASTDSGDFLEIEIPLGVGVAGHVAKKGMLLSMGNLYNDSTHNLHDRRVDEEIGYKTRSILCVPIFNKEGLVIGVIQLLNKINEPHFSIDDIKNLDNLLPSISHIIEKLSNKDFLNRLDLPKVTVNDEKFSTNDPANSMEDSKYEFLILNRLSQENLPIRNILYGMPQSNGSRIIKKLWVEGYIDTVDSKILHRLFPCFKQRREEDFDQTLDFTTTSKGYFRVNPLIKFPDHTNLMRKFRKETA